MFNIFKSLYVVFVLLCIVHQQVYQQECHIKVIFGSKHEAEEPATDILVSRRIDNHLPTDSCGCKAYQVKKKINPYKNCKCDVIPPKIFGSVYLQCATCLTIAQEISNVLGKTKFGFMNPEKEIELLGCTLKAVCQEKFNKFDLRRYNGYNYLMETSDSTTHVCSEMDGKWPLKLEEMCSTYINQINIRNFYHEFLKKPFKISNYLCRNNGIFRACSNVNFTTPAPVVEIYKPKGLFC